MNDGAIAHNRSAHDRLGDAYDGNPPEIFHAVEQDRLAGALADAVMAAGEGLQAPLHPRRVACWTGRFATHL